MTKEQSALAYMLLETHDMRSTVALMRQAVSGGSVFYRDVDNIRRTMLRRPNPPAHLALPDAQAAEKAQAAIASDALLKAQLSTGQHWITDRARFDAACQSVGLSA